MGRVGRMTEWTPEESRRRGVDRLNRDRRPGWGPLRRWRRLPEWCVYGRSSFINEAIDMARRSCSLLQLFPTAQTQNGGLSIHQAAAIAHYSTHSLVTWFGFVVAHSQQS